MSGIKITDLSELAATPAVGDLLPIVDVSDLGMSADGTTKKITTANLLGSISTDKLKSNPNSLEYAATDDGTNITLTAPAGTNLIMTMGGAGQFQFNDDIRVYKAKKLYFADDGMATYTYLASAGSSGILGLYASTEIDFNQHGLFASDRSLRFRDTNAYIVSDAQNYLDLYATTRIDLNQNTNVLTGKNLEFRDNALYITSANDGHLDFVADVSLDLNFNGTTLELTKSGSDQVITGGSAQDLYFDQPGASSDPSFWFGSGGNFDSSIIHRQDYFDLFTATGGMATLENSGTVISRGTQKLFSGSIYYAGGALPAFHDPSIVLYDSSIGTVPLPVIAAGIGSPPGQYPYFWAGGPSIVSAGFSTYQMYAGDGTQEIWGVTPTGDTAQVGTITATGTGAYQFGDNAADSTITMTRANLDVIKGSGTGTGTIGVGAAHNDYYGILVNNAWTTSNADGAEPSGLFFTIQNTLQDAHVAFQETRGFYGFARLYPAGFNMNGVFSGGGSAAELEYTGPGASGGTLGYMFGHTASVKHSEPDALVEEMYVYRPQMYIEDNGDVDYASYFCILGSDDVFPSGTGVINDLFTGIQIGNPSFGMAHATRTPANVNHLAGTYGIWSNEHCLMLDDKAWYLGNQLDASIYFSSTDDHLHIDGNTNHVFYDDDLLAYDGEIVWN